jgi:DDE superfamily endonuclease/Helix-turn-helix of DDE superfamily endonuclease
MIFRREHLGQHPAVFRSLTGLTVAAFDQMLPELLDAFAASRRRRLDHPGRRRAFGAGDHFDLSVADQLLLTVVWLRHYPTQECLGYLFGVSDSTALRAVRRCLPVLEKSGKDTMRLPDPGKGKRRDLPALLQQTPALAVIVDTFEQRVQRPRDQEAADRHYSGKKQQHTLKTQVATDRQTGQIVDIPASVCGPTNDLALLKASGLLDRLDPDVGALGDLAYVGIAPLHPAGLGFTPRRKPREKPRPPEDVVHNPAFAAERISVEHTIGRLRRYQALTQLDRHHRQAHTARVRAVAGLVNRQLEHRFGALRCS